MAIRKYLKDFFHNARRPLEDDILIIRAQLVYGSSIVLKILKKKIIF